MARIVLLSDTHNHHDNISLPSGDILIHSGDATGLGYEHQIRDFIDWMKEQDFEHKIYVPGNHDIGLEENFEEWKHWFADADINLLNEESVVLEGVSAHDFNEYKFNVFGSPITPNFGKWAFMRARGEQINKHWKLIPENTDILVTHGPPKYILDEIPGFTGMTEHVGCEMLAHKVFEIKPKLHVFGHIHEGAGAHSENDIDFVNAALCDEWNRLVNLPIVKDLK